MISWIQGPVPGFEVNLVFARGISLDALNKGLHHVQRTPLTGGESGAWAWAVHEMFELDPEGYENTDYEEVDYSSICPDGAEIVVFVLEPCSAKGFPPAFEYHRSGRLVLRFNFESIGERVGDNPDYLSAEFLAAHLIGPGEECSQQDDDGHDCFDHHYDDHARIVRAIAGYFALPSPPLTAEVTAK
ncbi:hypothetical protein [Streptomyces sp. NPDC050738]|uniref:hypothetical protein n=1 Tax=Streptomyces sp. NPDC050738 TaxID=3154744 RepID=UPI00343B562A